jgi:serine/threonine-protein kinase
MTPLLRLLGYPTLEGANGEPMKARATQRHRLALLAVLGSTALPWSRDKLIALLWPESTMARARNSLNESLYVLRGALGDDVVVSGTDEVRLADGLLRVDVREMEAALSRGDPLSAVGWYRGSFLDGFFVSRAPEFEQWAASERDRVTRLDDSALEQLATTAGQTGDLRAAGEWWSRLAATRPYDSRIAAEVMRASAAAGDRAGALDHFRAHAALLRSDFATDPPPELGTLADQIRTGLVTTPPARPPAAPPRPRSVAPTLPTDSDDPVAARSTPSYRRSVRPILAVVAIAGVLIVGAALALRAREGSARPASRVQPAVAVLPFEIQSGRAEDEYLALGMADALITRLSSTRRLNVRPTNVIAPLEGGPTSPREAARLLAVPYVFTGVVQRADSQLDVRVQLFREPGEQRVWVNDFRIGSSGLSRLADSIAAQSINKLLDEPSAPNGAAARSTRQADADGYAWFLRGRARLAHHREADTREAVAAFERAIELDSAFALAHAGLAVASAEMHLRFSTTADAAEWAERAVHEAHIAFALDSALPEVHEALAAVHRKTEFDWSGTIAESREAIRLDPGAPMPYFYLGGALYHLGLLDEAERAVREGLRVQPVGDRAEALRTLGTVALAAGRYAEAVALLQDVQRLTDRPVSDPHLAAAYFYAGDTTRSIDLLEGLLGSASTSAATRARALLASILAHRGDSPRAMALLDQATHGTTDHHVAYSIGAAYAQLGQRREAVRWLRAASLTGFQCYPWYERDPLLSPLRRDPAFVELLRSLRAQWQDDRRRYTGD